MTRPIDRVTHEALPIDPRAVERRTAYICRSAHIHACDPVEYQRRYLNGLRVKAKARRAPCPVVDMAGWGKRRVAK